MVYEELGNEHKEHARAGLFGIERLAHVVFKIPLSFEVGHWRWSDIRDYVHKHHIAENNIDQSLKPLCVMLWWTSTFTSQLTSDSDGVIRSQSH